MKLLSTCIFSAYMLFGFFLQAQPVADFSFTIACSEVTFTDQSTGTIVAWAWDFGDGGTSTAQNPINLYTAPGSYTVTFIVQDNLGNRDTVSQMVSITPSPVASITPATVVICAGQAVTLNALATGGTNPYTYDWSTGFLGATHNVSPTATTVYTVTATDNNGCTTTASRTVTVNPNPTAAIAGGGSVCAGATVTIFASGGTSYQWSNGATTVTIQVSPTSNTVYTVTVIDNNGCTASAARAVTVFAGPIANITPANATICSGQNVLLTASGGSSYDWSNGSSSASITVAPTSTTTYTVTVSDANGCVDVATRTVNVTGASFSLTTSTTTATCNGICDGTATANVTGGNPPFSYQWQGIPGTTTATATGLCPGNYTVLVMDGSGCQQTRNFTITAVTAISVNTNASNLTCFGDCNSNVTFTVSGGTSGYTYQASAGTIHGDSISNLCAGQYSLTVTDSVGCIAMANFFVVQPSRIVPNVTNSSVSCFGTCDGVVTTNTIGATPPYTYLWSNGATTSLVNGLCAGDHTVTITDNRGCAVIDTFNTTTPPQLDLIIQKQDALCNNPNSGLATGIVTGGSAAYAYHWGTNPPQTTATATGLAAGTYFVTVTDMQNCTDTASVTILQQGVTASVATINSSCGNADGSATVTITGAFPPFTYTWNTTPTQNTATATGLAAGNYLVTITDSTGCADTIQATISDAGAPTVNGTSSPATCASSFDGAIDLVILGGTAPFTYMWSSGAATEDLTGVGAGNYFVTVTDANGCVTPHTVTVGQTPITLFTTTTPATCFAADGSATVQTAGGTTPFTYQWSNGQTTQTATNLPAAWYSVTVTDTFGCYRHTNVFVDQPSNCHVTITGTVYFDADSNCVQDLNEAGIPNVWIDYEPGGLVQTDQNGTYAFTVVPGTYTITQLPGTNYTAICPASGIDSVTLTTPGAISNGHDFANEIFIPNDLELIAITCGTARPGFNHAVYFSIRNRGNTPASGHVEFILDSRVNYSSSNPNGVVSGDTVTFTFSNLAVNATITYVVNSRIPTSLLSGNVVVYSVTVYPDGGDSDPENNTVACDRMVTGSYDPNDKQVIPAGESPDGNITLNDSVMQYTIRFQNTGTDTAFTVVIKDTLDSHLDYRTFRQGTASHPYTVFFEEDDVVVFNFENILLPDSNVNEPASHGHVTFTIEHNGTLPLGTTVANRAAIYFDYNLPIITNTVSNKIYDPTGIREVYTLADNVRLYPNPAQDAVMVEGINGEQFTGIFITDMLGKRVFDSGRVKTSKQSIRIANFSAGVYFISVLTEKGVSTKKLMVE